MLELSWSARTHAGNRRSRNEDRVLARAGLFAVADGMGGHDAGDVASQTTIDHLDELAELGPVSRLAAVEAIRAANDELLALGRGRGQEIGTTICALVVTGTSTGDERFALLNVGDSRAYRFRDGRLEQLTHDHSVVQELIDAGMLDPRDAEAHPERHVITRSLGGEGHLDIDWWPLEPQTGDRLLLASDGLTREVPDREIAAMLAGDPEPSTTAERLLDAALAAGGRDNISVVVVDVLAHEPAAVVLDLDALDGDTTPRPAAGLDADTEPAGSSR